jgi:hypothetical protein
MARKLNSGLRSRSSLWTSAGDPSCAAIAIEKPPVYVVGSSVMVGTIGLTMTYSCFASSAPFPTAASPAAPLTKTD